MKPSSHSAVKAKRKAKVTAKKAGRPARAKGGADAVALAVGRALMRKPRVNPVLLEMMRRNRDLLPL